MTETAKHITLGVAGHIDHGKTSLVHALTGVDTDRLKEEKERGTSIVLGFAPLTLPNSGVADFIDVPGHEKFVGTMIAGASGIDALLLVIAATERIKPQTIEHLQLAELLGIRRGLVALTKCDLLDDAERNEAAEQISGFLSDTILENAPIISTSAVTGEGLDTLRQHLLDLLEETEIRPPAATFTLPIDRAFVMPGYGTIVTGTLHGANLHVGQSVEIAPGGRRVDVRGLQVHGREVEVAEPGWRVAVNLRGVKKDEIRHGDLLAAPSALRPTNLIDAELRLLLPLSKPLTRGSLVRLHFGTSEVNARVFPLDRAELAPGEYGFVQFRLPEQVAAPAGTPFVIRSLSPVETLGGGRLLDLHPFRKPRLSEDSSALLDALASDDPTCKIAHKLREADVEGRNLYELLRDLNVTADLEQQIAADSLLPEVVPCGRGIIVHADALQTVKTDLLSSVRAFHELNPRLEGMPQSQLRRKMPIGIRDEVLDQAFDILAISGEIVVGTAYVRLADFQPTPLTPDEARIIEGIENSFRRAKLQPPDVETVTRGDTGRRELFRMLLKAGRLVQTTDRSTGRSIVFHAASLAEAERLLSSYVAAHPEGFTVSEANQTLGTTRKFSIPLLEYLDAQGKTVRIADRRIWTTAL